MSDRREFRRLSVPLHLAGPLAAVMRERRRQDEKFGWPRGYTDGTAASYADLADRQKAVVAAQDEVGRVEWADVLLEEVFEALAEPPQSVALRDELVQVAAVALAWVQALEEGDTGGGVGVPLREGRRWRRFRAADAAELGDRLASDPEERSGQAEGASDADL